MKNLWTGSRRPYGGSHANAGADTGITQSQALASPTQSFAEYAHQFVQTVREFDCWRHTVPCVGRSIGATG
jgi:hypothetical protein